MRRTVLLFLLLSFTLNLFAQNSNRRRAATADAPAADSVLLSKVKYRLVGPFRGGRSAAVAGSYRNKNTFYFGATGGGVWKTTDGGSNWKNISDKYFGSSIGAVAVAPSDEDILKAAAKAVVFGKAPTAAKRGPTSPLKKDCRKVSGVL
jgi:hypothetical protein